MRQPRMRHWSQQGEVTHSEHTWPSHRGLWLQMACQNCGVLNHVERRSRNLGRASDSCKWTKQVEFAHARTRRSRWSWASAGVFCGNTLPANPNCVYAHKYINHSLIKPLITELLGSPIEIQGFCRRCWFTIHCSVMLGAEDKQLIEPTNILSNSYPKYPST